ncbi:MAG: hypothetical protein RBR35_13645 [Salinivirgaceae bacterium]|nr:hypothetical protein [Salinivirgaceae bacterium]
MLIDLRKCVVCVAACPCDARTMDQGGFHGDGTPVVQQYETKASFEYGRKWPRSHKNLPVGMARWCFGRWQPDSGGCVGRGLSFSTKATRTTSLDS